ncbi:MAG: translational GTPase TypA [Elusimicrobiota bacterium]|jgi:GTP-binding protein
MKRRPDIRNVAIIAHVDHGKTTLVDSMLKLTGAFKVHEGGPTEMVLDANDLERERGITILAKCTSVRWKDVTVNIVDTPGHADFGSEVERILRMVDGVLLLVDAADGPMPQTKFVLRKALAQGLAPIVVINKMDRNGARPAAVLDEVACLFIDLGAQDHQIDFPVLYASGREGWASRHLKERGTSVEPLFESIIKHIPGPQADEGLPLQMMITMSDYSSYHGSIGIGRIHHGRLAPGQPVSLLKPDGRVVKGKITRLDGFVGLERKPVASARAGDIVALSGPEDIEVNDTISDPENPQALEPTTIDAPTLAMEFMVNDSPFAGREGKFVTSRHLKARLEKERRINVGLRVEELPGEGHFKVSGRGELHLSVLIETMRREGFEFAVSRPEVIYREVNGVLEEPTELLVLDIEALYQGAVFESLGRRGARMVNMHHEGVGRLRLEYVIAARALLGFKSELLTLTRGTGVLHHSFHGYAPKSGEVPLRANGVMIAKEPGESTGYALYNLQDRATMFIGPNVPVYPGMVVGQNSRDNDLVVNPAKQKQMSNMRSKASDEALVLTPPRLLSLEQAIEFIDVDELVEVTPKSIRLRKKILDRSQRKRAERDDEDDRRD